MSGCLCPRPRPVPSEQPGAEPAGVAALRQGPDHGRVPGRRFHQYVPVTSLQAGGPLPWQRSLPCPLLTAVSDVHHVDVRDLLQRTDVLSRYLSDGRKQLEALWALEDVLEQMERPHSQCRPRAVPPPSYCRPPHTRPPSLQMCCGFCLTSCWTKPSWTRTPSTRGRWTRSEGAERRRCSRSPTSSLGSAHEQLDPSHQRPTNVPPMSHQRPTNVPPFKSATAGGRVRLCVCVCVCSDFYHLAAHQILTAHLQPVSVADVEKKLLFLLN